MSALIPAYSEKGILIYHGDSRVVLEELLSYWEEQVDLVLTDPPYGISYQSNYRTKKELLGKKISNDESLNVLEDVYPYLVKLLKQNTSAYFFAHPNMIGENRKILDKELTYKNTIVWDKGEGGTFGDLEAGYSLNWEAILYYNKGRRKLNGSRPRCIARHMPPYLERSIDDIPKEEILDAVRVISKHLEDTSILSTIAPDIISKSNKWHPKDIKKLEWSARSDQTHPTSKSPMLCEWLIKNSTNEGDMVLDCFMGAGSAAVAAKKSGRAFIGIETTAEFIDRAVDKLRNI